MLNIGASPQQVLDAQHFAADQAAQQVAAQAELLHQASMNEVESQVRDVLNEAGSTVDQLREQLRASEFGVTSCLSTDNSWNISSLRQRLN